MFTKDQQQFLDHHKIPSSQVLDGSVHSKDAIQKLMKEGDYVVVVGVKPCEKAKHTMRLKSGHCVQCNPQNLGFRGNFYRPGSVYILHSQATKLVKVGSTSQGLNERVKKLNAVRYGRTSDWTMIANQEFNEAGLVEFAIHSALRAHRVTGSYDGQSRDGECHEIFNCSTSVALAALHSAASQITTRPHPVR